MQDFRLHPAHPIAQNAIGWGTLARLLADAEFSDQRFVALGIVFLEVVK
jgi:hypothetical protein